MVQDEAMLDAVTAISGSGPAYVFYLIEALQQAASQMGFNSEQARRLSLATFLGASKLAAGKRRGGRHVARAGDLKERHYRARPC